MLLLATVGFILVKPVDIFDTSKPFVPMSRSVATLLNFQPSQSSRVWLALHWCSAVSMVIGLARGVLVGNWRTFDLNHWMMAGVLSANITLFGGLPVHVAVALNVGFMTAACLAWLGLRRWKKSWCLYVYILAAGAPVLAEAIIYLGYETWYRLMAPVGTAHLVADNAGWWTALYLGVVVVVSCIHLRPQSPAHNRMVKVYARALRFSSFELVVFGLVAIRALFRV